MATSYSIGKHFEAFIERLIASGRYSTASEIIRDGLRLIEERGGTLDPGVRAEVLHGVACHHDLRAARTAEAAVLFHANQLDAVAATRPVSD